MRERDAGERCGREMRERDAGEMRGEGGPIEATARPCISITGTRVSKLLIIVVEQDAHA
jgi:hypothetical protein